MTKTTTIKEPVTNCICQLVLFIACRTFCQPDVARWNSFPFFNHIATAVISI